MAWLYGGMSPSIYIARLHEAFTIKHFEVGMIKAPFMALVVGVVACSEGLRVKGSAELLGARTTTSVVKVHLSGDRARRPLRHVLRLDRDLTEKQVAEPVIRVRDLVVGFGERLVLRGLSLDVRQGEILALVGGSGSGKSVLMRTIIGLIPKRRGTIEVLGALTSIGRAMSVRRAIERRWGILYQQGALFSSLNLLQNIEFPMREHLEDLRSA